MAARPDRCPGCLRAGGRAGSNTNEAAGEKQGGVGHAIVRGADRTSGMLDGNTVQKGLCTSQNATGTVLRPCCTLDAGSQLIHLPGRALAFIHLAGRALASIAFIHLAGGALAGRAAAPAHAAPWQGGSCEVRVAGVEASMRYEACWRQQAAAARRGSASRRSGGTAGQR